jgi:hypothetical protein
MESSPQGNCLVLPQQNRLSDRRPATGLDRLIPSLPYDIRNEIFQYYKTNLLRDVIQKKANRLWHGRKFSSCLWLISGLPRSVDNGVDYRGHWNNYDYGDLYKYEWGNDYMRLRMNLVKVSSHHIKRGKNGKVKYTGCCCDKCEEFSKIVREKCFEELKTKKQ